MSTYFELSKVAQDQILATIKQGQELALSGVEPWAKSIAPLAKNGKLAAITETPAPKDVVANSFGFAEQLLASQKAFAEQIVAATAPTFAAAGPKSD